MAADALAPVPDDFPRSRHPASVGGVQPKLTVRLVNGKFTDRWTDAELYARFDNCADLVVQLTAYSQRKLKELPGATLENLLPRVRNGMINKGWDLTSAELDWIMSKVAERMSGPDDGAAT
jgi:hypothetical protein